MDALARTHVVHVPTVSPNAPSRHLSKTGGAKYFRGQPYPSGRTREDLGDELDGVRQPHSSQQVISKYYIVGA